MSLKDALLVKLVDGLPVFPYSYTKLRRDKPMSWPDEPSEALLAEHDCYPATVLQEPSYDRALQSANHATPAQVNGVWTVGWDVTDKPIAEMREAYKAKVDGVFARAKAQPILVNGSNVQMDPATLVDLLTADTPALPGYKDVIDGVPVTVSQQDLAAIKAGMKDRIKSAREWRHDKYVEINAATTIAELQAIDLSAP